MALLRAMDENTIEAVEYLNFDYTTNHLHDVPESSRFIPMVWTTCEDRALKRRDRTLTKVE